MAAFVKYEKFAEDLAAKVHDLFGTSGSTADVLKVMLSNTAPNVATHSIRTDVTEIAAGNGYTSGGTSVANVGTRTGGTVSVTSADTVVFTASGGSMATFQYAILYNDTPTSPADPLIGYWDYASAVVLATGETFTVDFGATLFTIV